MVLPGKGALPDPVTYRALDWARLLQGAGSPSPAITWSWNGAA